MHIYNTCRFGGHYKSIYSECINLIQEDDINSLIRLENLSDLSYANKFEIKIMVGHGN